MKTLELITWPFIKKEIDKIIEENKEKIIILDWALIPKTEYFINSNLNMLIDINYNTRLQRIIDRDSINEQQFQEREKASLNYKDYKFDYIINEINQKERVRTIYEKSIIPR